jgi:FtsH-binding integral membrane protein
MLPMISRCASKRKYCSNRSRTIVLTQPQFGGSVAEATLPIRMQFIRKVYAILTMQILLTTALSSISFFSDSYKNWIQSNQWMMWVSIFGAIGFMLLTYWKRKSYVSTQVSLAYSSTTNAQPSL